MPNCALQAIWGEQLPQGPIQTALGSSTHWDHRVGSLSGAARNSPTLAPASCCCVEMRTQGRAALQGQCKKGWKFTQSAYLCLWQGALVMLLLVWCNCLRKLDAGAYIAYAMQQSHIVKTVSIGKSCASSKH